MKTGYERWDIVDVDIKGEKRRAVFLKDDPNGPDNDPWAEVYVVTGEVCPLSWPDTDEGRAAMKEEHARGVMPMGRWLGPVSLLTPIQRCPFPPE